MATSSSVSSAVRGADDDAGVEGNGEESRVQADDDGATDEFLLELYDKDIDRHILLETYHRGSKALKENEELRYLVQHTRQVQSLPEGNEVFDSFLAERIMDEIVEPLLEHVPANTSLRHLLGAMKKRIVDVGRPGSEFRDLAWHVKEHRRNHSCPTKTKRNRKKGMFYEKTLIKLFDEPFDKTVENITEWFLGEVQRNWSVRHTSTAQTSADAYTTALTLMHSCPC